ncbi:MHYT domain-containing protein [Streptomyces thermoviolaceus]|uniref:MHYT domain-containing protein n=1 Tax=Streptomyces thermoviolaceus TaxID=1952 RepID=UPI0033BCC10C
MHGTVDDFGYGLVTPLVGYLMACLGGALGLRCTARALCVPGSRRPGWLALGAAAIVSGTWTMHVVGMMGFTIDGAPIRYDRPTTYASLLLAVVMVGVGIFIVGYRGATGSALFTGGTITGLGIASMHYLGMAGIHFDGAFEYNTLTVAASVLVAMAAATAALWVAGTAGRPLRSIGASLVMGVAAGGMHYAGMGAVSVHVHGAIAASGKSPAALLAPLLIGPLALLLLAGVVVLLDPLTIKGRGGWTPVDRSPGVPAPRLPAPSAVHPDPPAARRPHTPQQH